MRALGRATFLDAATARRQWASHSSPMIHMHKRQYPQPPREPADEIHPGRHPLDPQLTPDAQPRVRAPFHSQLEPSGTYVGKHVSMGCAINGCVVLRNWKCTILCNQETVIRWVLFCAELPQYIQCEAARQIVNQALLDSHPGDYLALVLAANSDWF